MILVFNSRINMRNVSVYFLRKSFMASLHTKKDSRDFCPTNFPNILSRSWRCSTVAFLKAESAASWIRSSISLWASSMRRLKDARSAFNAFDFSCNCIFVNCVVFPCQACHAMTNCIRHIRVMTFTSSFFPESADIDASSTTNESRSFLASSCAIINCSIIASVWSRCSCMRKRTCSISMAADSLNFWSTGGSSELLPANAFLAPGECAFGA